MSPFVLLLLGSAPGFTGTSSLAVEVPFDTEQRAWIESRLDERDKKLRAEAAARAQAPAVAQPDKLEIKAEAYMKFMYRNNSSQGCVTYGNPHPLGDNYSGDNGACPEFSLSLIGRPHKQLEGGFRIQSRFGQQFADWFENGDKRQTIDASGESLGQNHSAPLQLRGIYVRVNKPLPGIDWVLAGSSSLTYWDPWTVGKVRFINRFNAKGLFLSTSIGDYMEAVIARIALGKLFGTANYGSLEDPLVTNPFWARDAIYAVSLRTRPGVSDKFSIVLNSGVVLDEEADVRDPDAPGSNNALDRANGVTAVAARFWSNNTSLTVNVDGYDSFNVRGIFAMSHNHPNLDYVSNLALGGLGFSNVVYDQVTDFAGTLRVEAPDLLYSGGSLKFEYFNVGADYNAIVGSRREDDVLLTDGFLDGGELPTLNTANELIDFTDEFYETIIGWHGGTAMFVHQSSAVDFDAEATFLTYNTNQQDRDMNLYPGFGGFTGYTDTQLFSYANTNDRGRDPRAVYQRNQDRLSAIAAAKLTLRADWWTDANFEFKAKYIFDKDGRDADFAEDDYQGHLLISRASIGGRFFERLTTKVGIGADYWIENGRSGTYAGGNPNFLDYNTLRLRPFVNLRYTLGPLSAGYHVELITKSVDTGDPNRDVQTGAIFRSLGWLAAQF